MYMSMSDRCRSLQDQIRTLQASSMFQDGLLMVIYAATISCAIRYCSDGLWCFHFLFPSSDWWLVLKQAFITALGGCTTAIFRKSSGHTIHMSSNGNHVDLGLLYGPLLFGILTSTLWVLKVFHIDPGGSLCAWRFYGIVLLQTLTYFTKFVREDKWYTITTVSAVWFVAFNQYIRHSGLLHLYPTGYLKLSTPVLGGILYTEISLWITEILPHF